MWNKLSRIIIRYRIFFVIGTILLTAYLGYEARNLEMSFEYATVVPKDDPDYIFFEKFKKKYGEDGNIMVVGFQDQRLFRVNNFAKYQHLCDALSHIAGVNEVISLPTLRRLHKDTSQSKFILQPIFTQQVQYQPELDSLLSTAYQVRFYDGLVFNKQTGATLIAITLNREYLNSARRKELIGKITTLSNDFSLATDIQCHFAGLPYVRYIMISAFKEEFNFLLAMSCLVTCTILFFFFRSMSSVLFTILVIGITVIWTGGITALFGYKISLLTGMLPALIVVISIPTCIYMFNKYHQEFRRHGNKVKAVSRIIQKIGFITFMTNANTAVGFLVLVFTDISIIKEFGMVAGIMSFATFIITIIVIPSLFIYLPQPSEKQMMHLDKQMLAKVNDYLSYIVMNHRKWIYGVTLLTVVVSIFGILMIRPIGYMVDDMPERSSIKPDLAFFEKNFAGVMPLEILIDLGKKKAVYKVQNLMKIEEFEQALKAYPAISAPISIISIIKSATQAFYNNSSENYRIPNEQEKNFIVRYFGRKNSDLAILRSFVDSNAQMVRLSMKVADLGTEKMNDLLNVKLKNLKDSLFKDSGFEVNITGTSLLFLKGNQFLLRDLTESMLYAFALISLMMAFLFFDIKMIILSVIPNVIPMVITAGLMGFFDIRLKMSTAVIFSISFGITIDSTIHYLSKYKQEIATPGITVLEAVIKSLKEGGISMIYTGLVLIFGFGIFIFSDFGGTVALGILTCLTLFFAMLTNMILLPALLVTFAKPNTKN